MSDERPGFRHGVFAGFAGFVVLAHVIVVLADHGMRAMYRDFSPDIRLPLLTRLTMHPVWTWGTSLVGAGSVVLLLVARPRSIVPYVLVAVVMTGIAVLTYWYPRAPIFELAGNIQAD